MPPKHRLKDLEKSTTSGSIFITNGSRVPIYLPPDADGYVLTLDGGLPEWKAPIQPSEFEQYANLAAFPVTGEADKIYLDQATNKFYIWNGSTYIEIPTASMFSFTISGNSGPSQTISNADTFAVRANKGFTAVASATDTVTITPPSGSNDGDVMLWDTGSGEWTPGTLGANNVSVTPAGNIASTDVEAALNELDGDKQADIQWQNEGVNVGAAGAVTTVNVVGAGGTATILGSVLTITIPANAGEANTASNVNVGGVGVFKQKTGVNLEFRGINASDASIVVALDGANNEIDLEVGISATSGNVISTDGSGILSKPVTEYFTPADASDTLTLAATPKTGTVIRVYRNGIIEPPANWSIVANVITMDDPFEPSKGGEEGVQTAHVDYWVG